MKRSNYKSYDELPLFLQADLISDVLGISISSAYELMHEKGFPALRIGSRIVVPREKFIQWVDENTSK
ncbi:MAG: helix-turn-helix domain-containing protein [Ruminococcaceae bacterium]|nr:helix-turn-helix domain-containing protein [Oscillospiraceae bacterium]